MTKRFKMIAAIGLLLALALPVAFFAFDSWLRAEYRRRNLEDIDIHRMILYSGRVHRKPHQTLSFRMFGLNAEMLVSADCPLNNLGYFSDHDYDLSRGPSEFRIVVIGGEQTASSVANRSWPDILEERLRATRPDVGWKVLNIAWPDAGPMHYIDYWKDPGQSLAPDLVIVNYVETDFFRNIPGSALKYRGLEVGCGQGYEFPLTYRVGPEEEDVATLMALTVKGRTVDSLRDSYAIVSRPYGLFTSRSVMDDRAKVLALQQAIVQDMIEGVAQPVGSMAMRRILGRERDIPRVHTIRNFDPAESNPPDEEKMIRLGIQDFGWLVDHVPNLVLTHNFHYYELQDEFRFTKAMTLREPKIQVIDMRKRIPPGTSDEEIRSWYLIPHMSEKWSDKGHAAYARMMCDLVLEWKAARGG